MNDTKNFIEYFKVASCTAISKCHPFGLNTSFTVWAPTIENPNAVRAFMSKSPYEVPMMDADEVPMMDVMFGFNSKVRIF